MEYLDKGAEISVNEQFRYSLWRTWDKELPKVGWIMLNPSTADSQKDDPTIRRCVNFAKSWGYGGIMVFNIHPYRTKSPKELKEWFKGDPSIIVNNAYKRNRYTIENSGSYFCEKLICAWGNKEKFPDMLHFLGDKLYYLDRSINGVPKHPLYLKGNLKPIKL